MEILKSLNYVTYRFGNPSPGVMSLSGLLSFAVLRLGERKCQIHRKESCIFEVSEEALEKIKQFMKGREGFQSIRILMPENGREPHQSSGG